MAVFIVFTMKVAKGKANLSSPGQAVTRSCYYAIIGKLYRTASSSEVCNVLSIGPGPVKYQSGSQATCTVQCGCFGLWPQIFLSIRQPFSILSRSPLFRYSALLQSFHLLYFPCRETNVLVPENGIFEYFQGQVKVQSQCVGVGDLQVCQTFMSWFKVGDLHVCHTFISSFKVGDLHVCQTFMSCFKVGDLQVCHTIMSWFKVEDLQVCQTNMSRFRVGDLQVCQNIKSWFKVADFHAIIQSRGYPGLLNHNVKI